MGHDTLHYLPLICGCLVIVTVRHAGIVLHWFLFFILPVSMCHWYLLGLLDLWDLLDLFREESASPKTD